MKKLFGKKSGHCLTYGLFCLALLMGLVILFLNVIPPEQRRNLLIEAGPIEGASAMAWFACCVFLFIYYLKNIWKDWWLAAVICLLFGLRELDFHKKFTVMSIEKIKFYLEPVAPASEKILIGAIVLMIFFFFYVFIRNNISTFWQALKNRQTSAVVLALAIFLLPISKILDRFPNRLQEAGISLPEIIGQQASLWEEVLELMIPLLFLLLILHGAKLFKPAETE